MDRRLAPEVSEELLTPYRMRTVRIGVQTTVLTLVALLVFALLPERGELSVGPFVVSFALAAAGAAIVAVLPWQRLFDSGWGLRVFYAWSVLDIVLITALITATGGSGSEMYLLYGLTNIFFAASYPRRGQVALLAFTSGCYVAVLAYRGQLPVGTTFLRLALLALLVFMASFLSRELMLRMAAFGEAQAESARRATLIATVAARSRTFATMSPDEVLAAVSDAALDLGLDGADVSLIDGDTSTYVVVHPRGMPEGYSDQIHDATKGLVGRAVTSGRVAVVEDYAAFADGVESVREAGFRSAMAAPIKVNGQVYAVLGAGYLSDRRIMPEDIEAFELLASVAGRALESARRYEELEQRAELESQLHQAQKMEAVGQLAGGVAHDFNNLLAVIINYSSFLADRLPADDEVQEDLAEIRRAGERGARLVKQLLSLSRRQTSEPRPLDMSEAVTDMSRLLARMVGEGIKLELKLAPSVPPVLIDRTQFEQVLMNLVVNGRDAMPTGGTLTIATAEHDADGKPCARLDVTDTGPGIPEHLRARIFEPMFTTKEPGRGTGLGLSTSRGIVEESGGRITCRSEPGEGATFTVILPAIAEPRESDTSSEQGGRELGPGLRVLLVEDEEPVRRLVERILVRRGVAVKTAASGEEALEIARGGLFDLLLTDVIMPGMSGLDLDRALRERYNHFHTLFMSGYSGDILAPYGIEAGDPRHIQKPFSEEELVRKIAGLMDRSGQSLTDA